MLFPTDELWPESERSVAQYHHYDLNMFLQNHSRACDCIKSWQATADEAELHKTKRIAAQRGKKEQELLSRASYPASRQTIYQR